MVGATGGGREGDLRCVWELAPRNQAEPMTRFSSINVDKRRPPASSKNGLHRGVRGMALSTVEKSNQH